MSGTYNVTPGPFGAESSDTFVGHFGEPFAGCFGNTREPLDTDQRPLPDHAAATIGLLLSIVRKIRAGTCPDDLGDDVVLIGRMMRRK